MTLADDRPRAGLNVPYAVAIPDRIPARRYYDPEFYAMECELLWPRVWQMACRLEEIPEVGDFVEYKILDQSIIIVRVDATTVKAYHNACRHRGVSLVCDRGNVAGSGFICPFHGWCWGLEGDNTFLYQPDLFSDENRVPEDLRLQECRVETWGGCAFINLDDKAPSLRESIDPFATMHDFLKVESLRVDKWFAIRLPTNWKLAMEAFMEGYHVMETHPQLLPAGARGTVYKPIEAGAVSATTATQRLRDQLGTKGGFDKQAFIDMQIHFMRKLSVGMAGMTDEKDIRIAESLRSIDLPDDPAQAAVVWRRTLNDAIVAWHRNAGCDVPDLNAALDKGYVSSVNYCFPHFYLLPSYSSASSYRIRPLGPEECLFELWSLTRFPPGSEPPKPTTPTPIECDDPALPEIPGQDYSNLPRQQKGLHSKGFEYMRLSKHVEGLVSNYQRLIDGYLAGLSYDKLVTAVQRIPFAIDTPIVDLGF